MLLKHQRIKGKVFSNPLSPQHQLAMRVRAQEIHKVYEPKEKRLEKKNESNRAHFSLGSGDNASK